MQHRKTLWITYSILLALMACLAIRAFTEAAENPNHSIVLLIDNSQSIADVENPVGSPDGKPPDRDQKRIRFTRFLVRYMQAFFPGRARVGVISFATKPQPLVPLTPVEQWTHADLASVRSFNQDEDISPQERGTDFVRALNAAHEQFADACTTHERCAVIMFTDGIFFAGDEDPSVKQALKGQIEKTLRELRRARIQVYIVMFAGEKPSEMLSEGWKETRKTWDDFEEEELIGQLIINATVMEAREIYEEILDVLDLNGPLDGLLVREFEGATKLSIPVLPYRRYLRLFLLPDTLIGEAWTREPTIQAGVGKWWLDPQPGEIKAYIRSQGKVTQTLVYYTYSDEPYPINLEAQVIPDRQEVGRPVELQAWFTVGSGQLITYTSGFSVDARLESGEVYSLIPGHDGRFTHTFTNTLEGEYRLTFSSTVSPSLELGPVSPLKRGFSVGQVPRLYLTTSSLVDSPMSSTLSVTVTVGNFSVIQGAYTPTLKIVEQGAPISLAHHADGDFVGATTVFSNTNLTLRADLPDGFTNQGIPFEIRPIERQIVLSYKEEQSAAISWTDTLRRFLGIDGHTRDVLLAVVILSASALAVAIGRRAPHGAIELGSTSALKPDASPEAISESLKAFEVGGLEATKDAIRQYGEMVSLSYCQERESKHTPRGER